MRRKQKTHLTHLQTVYARVDVDAVRTEDAQQHDVHVIPAIYPRQTTEMLRRSMPVP